MSSEEQAEAKLREYGALFAQLMESERFKELLGLYFTFQQLVNEETKEITVQVIENPPEEVARRMQAKMHESENQIQIVSGSAAQSILETVKKQTKRFR